MLHTLVLLALTQVASPAPSLTLEGAFALADANHVDDRIAELTLTQAEQDKRASYQFIMPRVDLSAAAGISYLAPQTQNSTVPIIDQSGNVTSFATQRIDLPGYNTPDFNLGVRLSQPLYDGGRWWTAIDKGKHDLAAAQAQRAEARLQVHASVGHLFFELVRAQRSLDILAVNVQRSQEQVERAEALYQAGRGPKSDTFAAQVNLANDQIALAQQRAALDLARNSLNIALGREAAEPIAPQPPDIAQKPPLPDPKEIEKTSMEGRQGLAALRTQVLSAQDAAHIAGADYLPNVSANISYNRDAPVLTDTLGNPARQYVATGSVNLAWNLFEGHATDINVQKAEIAVEQSKLQLVKSERAVREEAQRAARTLAEDLETLELAEHAHASATEGMTLAKARFTAGAASNLEVRDAQLKLTSAELSLLSTQIDAQLAEIDVKAAQGQL